MALTPVLLDPYAVPVAFLKTCDTIVQRRIGTGCWRPPDPLVIECDPTLRMYNNRISEYLVSGNSAFWTDGRILGCEFPV